MHFLLLTDADLDVQTRVRELRNHPDVRKFMYTTHEIGEAEHRAWLDSLKGNERQSVFAVISEGAVIGVVSLNAINRVQKSADWAFYLDVEAQGRGVGSLMESWVLDYAFETAGLEKLNCEVLAINPAVIKMHQKFGFEIEGVRRQNILRDSQRLDVVLLGITKDEWRAKRPALELTLRRLSSKHRSP
jgi:UDP-4-amino-4,6-dideoxy-N-acetyl-beta-L-altrosamine N-acetyltransferase